jgi:putative heme iron utilization protein
MPQNESASQRRHASSGPATPALPEPSYAERVRTLLQLIPVAMLSTVSRRQAGYPFGSLMPFALDEGGRPLFLISSMAMHTQNLKADPRCSLFAVQESQDGDPLGAARVTVVGNAEVVAGAEASAVREAYLARHPNSRYWVDFEDFSFFRLEPVDVYFVGGFGVMGWVEAGDYATASADPLAEAAAGILRHMNADHVEAMIALARKYAGLEATEAAMTSVDRLGFWLRLKTAEGMKGARINFPQEVKTSEETRAALVSMVR